MFKKSALLISLLLPLFLNSAFADTAAPKKTAAEDEDALVTKGSKPIESEGACPDSCSDINEILKDRGILLIGEAEVIHFPKFDYSANARIDTGATTSSLGVGDITEFEKDSKPWVRFSVTDRNSKNKTKLEYPVSRVASIKQHNKKDLRRPAVILVMEMGKQKLKREFTLADRDKYDFPVLIGRNVLTDFAWVDVGLKYSLEPAR